MTQSSEIFRRFPELKELVGIIRYEIQQAQRPAAEIVLDDTDVQKLLRISKRKLQYLKSSRALTFNVVGNRSYYLLADVLDFIGAGRVEAINFSFGRR